MHNNVFFLYFTKVVIQVQYMILKIVFVLGALIA